MVRDEVDRLRLIHSVVSQIYELEVEMSNTMEAMIKDLKDDEEAAL